MLTCLTFKSLALALEAKSLALALLIVALTPSLTHYIICISPIFSKTMARCRSTQCTGDRLRLTMSGPMRYCYINSNFTLKRSTCLLECTMCPERNSICCRRTYTMCDEPRHARMALNALGRTAMLSINNQQTSFRSIPSLF